MITGHIMPDNSVKITLEAVDKTKAAFDQLESKSAGVVSSLKSHWLSFAAAAAAVYGVVKSVQNFIDIAAKAEQIESRMAFQIGTVGIEYQKVKTAIDSFSYSVQQSTGFSSENAQQGLGQMMQYTDNLAKAQNGVKLAMDMTTQTDLNLAAAIKIVGLAMEGNVEMIRIALPELKQLDAILGDNASKADKAAYSMRLLNDTFGGASQNDLETYAGKARRVSNAIQDIKRGIGEKIIGAIDWAKQTQFFKDWWAGVDSILGITKRKMAEAVKAEASEKIVADEQARADYAKRGYEEMTEYASAINELNTSYKILGATSRTILEGEVSKTLWAVEKIKTAWQAGKASATDYVNAMKKAMDVIKGAGGEDPTKKLVDLMIESEKKIKEIKAAGYDVETTKRMINEEIDLWLQRKKIIEDPVKTAADVGGFEEDLRGMVNYYNENVKRPIESNPIKIKIDKTEMDELRRQAGMPMENIVTFYGKGSSKELLSEKISQIIDQFGGMKEALSGMEALINFTEMTSQFNQLQKQLTQVQSVIPGLKNMVRVGLGTNINGPTDPHLVMQVKDAEYRIQTDMGLLQMKMLMELIRGFGSGSFQTGGRVPETGWYKLHRGEEVSSTNQLSDNRINNFYITSNDPKTVADEIGKVLQYGRSGILSDAIKRLR